MTVPDQTPQNVHTANGATTTFAYQFKILDTDHLEVYLDDVLQTSGYTVTGEGVNAGGTVVFTTAPANGTEVILMRSMTIERTAYDYQNAGDFLAATVNEDFDAAIMMAQQINNKLDQRALLFPATLDRTNNTNALPEPEEGRVLYWDENGEIQNGLLNSLANNVTFASELVLYDTMAQAIADADLTVTKKLLVKGRANSVWDLSGSGTANGYDVVSLTASGLYATLRLNDVVDVKALGAVGDGSTDDTLPIQHAFTLNRGVYISKGTYKLTDDIDTRTLGWSNGRALYGDGRYLSALKFYSCSGVFLDNEESTIHDMAIWGGELVDGYTGVAATDELLITANTYGLKLGRSHMEAYNLSIQGFDKGIYAYSRYYNDLHSIRALYNLYGFYSDYAAVANYPAFYHVNSCEIQSSYKANLYLDYGWGFDFANTSFENCLGRDTLGENGNYPEGGIYVSPDASANFNHCWAERCDIFLEGECTLSPANWRNTVCKAPQNIERKFAEVPSVNLVDPIWYPSPSWTDSSATLTRAIAQIDDGKRYLILSSTQGAGSSKNFYSDYNDLVRGIEYEYNNTNIAQGWHYVGMWVQFKTADVSMFDLQLMITDTNGTEYTNDSHNELYTAGHPDLTLVDEWQFVGYFVPIKSTNITNYPIEKVRLRLRYGLSAADYSGSARVMWLADPVLKLFAPDGHPIHDVNPQQRVSTINVSNPPTDAELDAAFGTPAQVGKNFNILINDNNSDANVYMVRSNGTSWWYTTLTKAV